METNQSKTEIFSIDPSRIVDVIGQGGRVIREITNTHGVTIDLDRENGGVTIKGENEKSIEGAKNKIIEIVNSPKKEYKREGRRDFGRGNDRRNFRREQKDVKFEIGEEFDGVVKNVAKFGAFIPLRDGVDGLLHISKYNGDLSAGDRVKVRVSEQNGNRISLELA
ncbi:MAG: S1 RNA-binding domain-containing protein [Campylobacter sp.]|nr:S1 RNA-binding domain-containing protein [Campylobacter sp.]